MDADFAVDPMMHRTPVQPIAILQSAEDALNLLLAGITGNHLIGSLIHAIGEQRGAAETFRPQLRERGVVHIECQTPATLALFQFVVKDLARRKRAPPNDRPGGRSHMGHTTAR